jgi:hypothetical protein
MNSKKKKKNKNYYYNYLLLFSWYSYYFYNFIKKWIPLLTQKELENIKIIIINNFFNL